MQASKFIDAPNFKKPLLLLLLFFNPSLIDKKIESYLRNSPVHQGASTYHNIQRMGRGAQPPKNLFDVKIM